MFKSQYFKISFEQTTQMNTHKQWQDYVMSVSPSHWNASSVEASDWYRPNFYIGGKLEYPHYKLSNKFKCLPLPFFTWSWNL